MNHQGTCTCMCWFNAGPILLTITQHWTSIGWTLWLLGDSMVADNDSQSKIDLASQPTRQQVVVICNAHSTLNQHLGSTHACHLPGQHVTNVLCQATVCWWLKGLVPDCAWNFLAIFIGKKYINLVAYDLPVSLEQSLKKIIVKCSLEHSLPTNV